MKVLGRIVIVLALLLVTALAIAYAVGAAQPRHHVASRFAVYPRSPDSLWAVITDWEGSPRWREDVSRVERAPDREGRPAWRLITPEGAMTLVIAEEVAPLRMVAIMADTSQGYGGSWTYILAPEGGGTRLTIVERGFIDHPLFRFLARFVFGVTSTADGYLTGLGRHLGTDVTPQDAGIRE
jgi:hypothetical protein